MIIFLDIDGVVLPTHRLDHVEVRAILLTPADFLDEFVKHSQDCVFHVKQLCAHHGAKIVVHSHWRRAFEEEFILTYLERVGLKEHLHDDWMCPMRFSSQKPHDIGMWLDEHPEVRRCIVIDDDPIGDVHPHREHEPDDGGDPIKFTVEVLRITPEPRIGLCEADIIPHLRGALNSA